MSKKDIFSEAKCEMEVLCDKNWDDLNPTEEDGIRFCKDCKKLVFYTQTAAELEIAAEKKLCVYVVPESGAHQLQKMLKRRQSDAAKMRREMIAKPLLGSVKLK